MHTFNINTLKRFGLYTAISLRHYWWYYMFVSIALVLVVVAMSYFYLFAQPGELKGFLNWSYWFFLTIGTANITASAFSLYANNHARLHLLTLPVSNGIKLASVVLCTIIIPFTIFSILFYLLGNAIAVTSSANDFTEAFVFNPYLNEINNENNSWLSNIAFYTVIQSVLLMSGSFFPKAGMIKTVLIFLAFFLIILLIDSATKIYSFDGNVFTNIASLLQSSKNSSILLVSQMPALLSFVYHLAGILLIPFSFYIVYLRLKEMEV